MVSCDLVTKQDSDVFGLLSLNIAVLVSCGLSYLPRLFNLYSEKVISEALELQHSITLNGEYISNARYTDDTALVAETGEQLQQMINNINDSCNKYGMSLNVKNTKVMVISKKDTGEQLAITVNNTRLEQVKQYTYLGSLITDDGRCIQEVKKGSDKQRVHFGKQENY